MQRRLPSQLEGKAKAGQEAKGRGKERGKERDKEKEKEEASRVAESLARSQKPPWSSKLAFEELSVLRVLIWDLELEPWSWELGGCCIDQRAASDNQRPVTQGNISASSTSTSS